LSKAYNTIYIYCECTMKYAKTVDYDTYNTIILLRSIDVRTSYSSANDNIGLLTVSSKKVAISFNGLQSFPISNPISLFMLTFGRTLFA